MKRYVLGRLAQAVVVIFFMSFIVFSLARAGGDPVALMAPPEWSIEEMNKLRAQLGLDQPWYVQYGIFLSNAVQGDFGTSIRTGRPAIELVMGRLPATIQLSIASLLISVLLAIPIGVYSAIKKGGVLDAIGRLTAVLGQSMPSFWLGLLFIYIFAVTLRVLPVGGESGGKYIVLPALTLGWYAVAGIMRLMRSSMLDVLSTEYVKLARAKGLSERVVIWKHALKNALLPVLTFISILFVAHLGGSVVTETVFGWPGVGLLLIQAVNWRDFPIIQTVVIVLSILYVLTNLIVDIAYAYLNPKIRYGRR
ncbi:MAG: ABC transporter permease [Chloroflexi bacterium]|nr:ABC transporter permease [Chloroflexota bacterium]